MLGRQIAENLRQNRERWCAYQYHDGLRYCVIGLKLHELGVAVETWSNNQQNEMISTLAKQRLSAEQLLALISLQNANDASRTVDDIIAYCEGTGDVEYALEALAQSFKDLPLPSDSDED